MNGLAARSTLRRARGACHTCGAQSGGRAGARPSSERLTEFQIDGGRRYMV